MKKYLSIICVIAMLASLTGCGSSDSSPSSSAVSSTEETTEATQEKTEITTEKPTEKTTEKNTEKATEAPTESETEPPTDAQIEVSLPQNTGDYVDYIGSRIDITDIIPMAAEMIGAEEGTSFKYNGNKFEIYRFKNDDPKIELAKSGSITYTIEGLGDFTSQSAVNGNYMMIYDTPDDAVISAFNILK